MAPGKTTLLKLIAGIYSPTLGNIEKTGKINCMLDIGFGFEPDATGYENIYLTNIFQGFKRVILIKCYLKLKNLAV